MAEEERFDTVIVGAGITGLTLAHYLTRAGQRVLVVEESKRLGGAICTVEENNFLLEIGPNTVLGKESLIELVSELDLNSELLVAAECAANRYLGEVTKDGEYSLKLVPGSPLKFLGAGLVGKDFYWALLRESFLSKPRSADTAVATFVNRHFGQSVAANLVAPMLSGIWAADISRLSMRSALPKLWEFEAEHGSLIRGGLKNAIRGLLKKRSGRTPRKKRPQLVSFGEGLKALPEKLAASLPVKSLALSVRVQRVVQEPNGFLLELAQEEGTCFSPHLHDLLKTRNLVLTGDAQVAARLLGNIHSELSKFIGEIPYAPLGVMHLTCPTAAFGVSPEGFGFLVPPRCDTALLGCIFSSAVFPGRGPSGQSLLTCFCGGAVKPQYSNVLSPMVKEQVVSEVSKFLKLREEPTVVQARYYERAVPNYALGHYRLDALVDDMEKKAPGLFISANWHRALGVADRIEDAAQVARRIISSQ